MNRAERRRFKSTSLSRRVKAAKRQLSATQAALEEVNSVRNEVLQLGDQESAERLQTLIDQASLEIGLLEVKIAAFDILRSIDSQNAC